MTKFKTKYLSSKYNICHSLDSFQFILNVFLLENMSHLSDETERILVAITFLFCEDIYVHVWIWQQTLAIDIRQ